MANRLKKLAAVSYSPGTPYQPFVAGYCIQVPYEVPGYQSYSTQILVDEDGNVTILQVSEGYVAPSTRYVEQCFPTQPEVLGVPATTTYTSINGWNGGARSVDQLDGDGYFEFQVRDVPAGIVIGLSLGDTSTLPNEPTHALYLHGTVLDVMESGVVVHTAPIAHDYDNLYRIQRSGLTVTYSTTGWSYESVTQASGARVLDAAIYASGDYVDNPVLSPLDLSGTAAGALEVLQGYGYGRQYDPAASNDAVGTLGAMQGHGYEGADYAEAYGTLGAMSGEASETPSYAAAYGTLGALTGEATQSFVTIASGSLLALSGVASEGEYVYGGGSLAALTGVADGGYPEFSLLYGVGIMAPLNGTAHGLTGEVGAVVATLEPMDGWASEGPYAEIHGTLPMFTGYADSGWPVPGETYLNDVVLVGDFLYAQDVQIGSISDSLEITDTLTVTIGVTDAIFDALMLSDTLTAQQAIDAFIGATLLLGNGISSLYQFDDASAPGRLVGGEPAQYAVNTLTNAFTNYSGFGFGSFATVGQTLYGAKADGIYRVRAGDDDGSTMDAFIDFGSTAFGSTKVKTVESVYLGSSTDGQLYVRMDTGLDSRLYRVIQRGDTMRALTAKGVGSRLWNVSLEIVDATDFELDVIEIQVGVASGRWRSR